MASKYDVIYADPPWAYNNASIDGAAARHYSTCECHKDGQFKALVDGWAADNCALFMWATWPKLREAFLLGDAWGFEYVTCAFVWVKTLRDAGQLHMFEHPRPEMLTVFGVGFYAKSNTEFVLLWRRGSIAGDWADNTIRQLVFAPRREHSRKPDEVRGLIERAYPDARRIEMFARSRAPGWDAWGSETEKFTEVQVAQDTGLRNRDRKLQAAAQRMELVHRGHQPKSSIEDNRETERRQS